MESIWIKIPVAGWIKISRLTAGRIVRNLPEKMQPRFRGVNVEEL